MTTETLSYGVLDEIARKLGGKLLPPNSRYNCRIEIGSWSVAGDSYVLARERSTGRWACGCPDWINRHGRRPDYECKHLAEAHALFRMAESQGPDAELPGLIEAVVCAFEDADQKALLSKLGELVVVWRGE